MCHPSGTDCPPDAHLANVERAKSLQSLPWPPEAKVHAYSIWMSIKERRSEPRTEAGAKIVMTPLAAVATRLHGIVVNVSPRGVRVRFATLLNVHPKAGEVYRIQSGNDVMLCEVRYCEFAGEGADVGLEILHWVKAGELNQLLKNYP